MTFLVVFERSELDPLGELSEEKLNEASYQECPFPLTDVNNASFMPPMARNYVVDLPGGTATTSVQIQTAGSMKDFLISLHSAAAGKLEVSLSGTSQIGTAAPDKSVLFRVNNSATANDIALTPATTGLKFKAFDTLYFHQTGAGNLGSVSFQV